MRMRMRNQQSNRELTGASSLAPEVFQARLLRCVLSLEHPVLLVGLSEEFVIEALASGLRADICDHSLESLERLGRLCLANGLEANLYWQSLVSLCLPDRYATIVLAPRSWRALDQPANARLVERKLKAQLLAGGQLKLLLGHPSSLESLEV